MRMMKPACLFAIAMLIVGPLAAASQDSTLSPSPQTQTGQDGESSLKTTGSLPPFSPQAVRKIRADIYIQAAREALVKLAPQVYELASNSERCRLNSGAKACDLPAEPLKGSDLQHIFKYYVKGPVEAALSRQQLDVQKSDWTWQTYSNHHSN
ncbi:MAG TPA: hypothetical protein VMX16_19760 [Terriglobia bacterium]|nr:hypothetical protein [Terriglobia bacterium]